MLMSFKKYVSQQKLQQKPAFTKVKTQSDGYQGVEAVLNLKI